MLRDLIGSEPSARFNPFPLTTATTIDQFGRFIDQIGQFAELDGRLMTLADTISNSWDLFEHLLAEANLFHEVRPPTMHGGQSVEVRVVFHGGTSALG